MEILLCNLKKKNAVEFACRLKMKEKPSKLLSQIKKIYIYIGMNILYIYSKAAVLKSVCAPPVVRRIFLGGTQWCHRKFSTVGTLKFFNP